MSATRTFIDPEISGLMREILSNPRAKLFKTPNPNHLPGVTGMMTPVGQHQAGLIPAERHLLQVYRQEVAWLLRQAALTRLYEDPKKGRLLRKSITVDRTLELLETSEVSQRLQTARDASNGANIADEEWDVFQLATSPTGTRADVARLCQASLRLAPSDEVRIYLAVDMGMRCDTNRAAVTLKEVLAGTPSTLIASYAWQNLGMTFSAAGSAREASAAYAMASKTVEHRPAPVIAWLFFAARCLDRHEVLIAAEVLDDLVSPEHPSVIEHCSAPPIPLSTASKKLLAATHDSLGAASRKVINASTQL